MEKFVTQAGVELDIDAVSTGAIQSLLGGSPVLLDLFSRASSGEDLGAVFQEMSPAEQTKMLGDFEPLYNYCVGWGVQTDPPDEVLAELELLGIYPKSKREARIKWLRILVLDQREIGHLVGRVLVMSVPESEPESEPED